jgi:membrane-associated phospholipid phosphatase
MTTDPLANATAAEKADAAVIRAFSARRENPVIRLLSAVGKLGDQPPLRALCAGAFGLGVVTGNRRLARAGVRMMAANALAGFIKNQVKQQIDRSRPELLIRHGHYEMGRGRSPEHAKRSFPSGHSACATAVGRALAREYPELSGLPEVAAAIIAASQVPRGTHYPTDVGAGSAIGWLSEWVVAQVLWPEDTSCGS